MPSKKSAHYGALAEKHARNKYGLVQNSKSWKDAEYSNGKPVEIKACRPDGEFRLWYKAHHRLTVNGGYYVFVTYKPAGSGIRVLESKRRKATTVTKWAEWFKSTHKRDEKETHLSPDTVL